jgi:hypothetical protein
MTAMTTMIMMITLATAASPMMWTWMWHLQTLVSWKLTIFSRQRLLLMKTWWQLERSLLERRLEQRLE